MNKKIKVLTLSDHPFSPSGVGTQTKYMIDYLYKTGKYQFVCLGGAVKHKDYRPQKVENYGDDLIIYPVDGYGTQDLVRQLLELHKPDYNLGAWTVFDSAGQMHGSLTMPAGVSVLQIGTDYVIGRWRDDLDVEHVRVYGIVKGGESS